MVGYGCDGGVVCDDDGCGVEFVVDMCDDF